MKCPECGKECQKGCVEAKEVGSLTQFNTRLLWYPAEEKQKILRKGTVKLSLWGEGYYCDECMTVFAAFRETR